MNTEKDMRRVVVTDVQKRWEAGEWLILVSTIEMVSMNIPVVGRLDGRLVHAEVEQPVARLRIGYRGPFETQADAVQAHLQQLVRPL